MYFSAAMTDAMDEALTEFLQRSDGQEDVCFALYHPSTGLGRFSGLLVEPIWPQDGDRDVHGNASFNAPFVERALAAAAEAGAGLALLHSHPLGRGWQGMSIDDVRAEKRLAPSAFGATDLPLLGLTQAGDGSWSARFWPRIGPRMYQRQDCVTVRLVGPRFRIQFNSGLLPPPSHTQQQVRTVSAWGDKKQADIARLRIAVIGCGSTGGVVAESLARMGIQRIVLVDFDKIEDKNLDRLTFASGGDIGQAKATVLGDYVKSITTSDDFDVHALSKSIVDGDAQRAVIDCDLIMCCVDRPWGRHLINMMGLAHLIPVIDGGILVRTNSRGHLASADWKTHVSSPGRACLRCLGQYDLGWVQTEREGNLDDPSYIEGLPDGHPLKSRENVSPFTLACASRQLLQFVSLVVEPLAENWFGAEHYHFVGDFWERMEKWPLCEDDCPIAPLVGRGDQQPLI